MICRLNRKRPGKKNVEKKMCMYMNSSSVYYNKKALFISIKLRDLYRDTPPARVSVRFGEPYGEEMRKKKHLAESFCLLPAGHRKIFLLPMTPLWK